MVQLLLALVTSFRNGNTHARRRDESWVERLLGIKTLGSLEILEIHCFSRANSGMPKRKILFSLSFRIVEDLLCAFRSRFVDVRIEMTPPVPNSNTTRARWRSQPSVRKGHACQKVELFFLRLSRCLCSVMATKRHTR